MEEKETQEQECVANYLRVYFRRTRKEVKVSVEEERMRACRSHASFLYNETFTKQL